MQDRRWSVWLLVGTLAVAGGCGDAGEPSTGLYDDPEFDSLEGTWIEIDDLGGGPRPDGDIVTFGRRPASYVEEITRQVGSDDTPGVPFPTICRYQQTSTRIELSEAPETAPYPYLFRFTLDSIQLVDSYPNDPGCAQFVDDRLPGSTFFIYTLDHPATDELILDGRAFEPI